MSLRTRKTTRSRTIDLITSAGWRRLLAMPRTILRDTERPLANFVPLPAAVQLQCRVVKDAKRIPAEGNAPSVRREWCH